MSPFRATLLFGAVPAGSRVGGFSLSAQMTASTRPRLPSRAVTYISAREPDAAWPCDTVEQATRIIQWLASVEARDGPARDRRARAAALIDWLADYALHVEQVERGCQRLLLQAAEQVGKASR